MPSTVLRSDALHERFDALDDWLVGHRSLWRPRPFAEVAPAWTTEHPAVAQWLLGLDSDAIDGLDGLTVSLRDGSPAELRRWLAEADGLTAVGAWPSDPSSEDRLQAERSLHVGVKGRKWGQVSRFCSAVSPPDPRAQAILDWCGGKGHLGRTLGCVTDRPVTVLEWDEALQSEALDRARRAGVTLRFVEGDALAPASLELLGEDVGVVALHACGDLMGTLIQALPRRTVGEVALAPCCFHRVASPTPLSLAGQAARLHPDHATLRLATAEEVSSPGRTRVRRRRENAWRLGFDLLLREATGVDRYTPLGKVDGTTLGLPFEGFCRAVASARDLPLPPRWTADAAQAAGEERERSARALSVVRALFRRPIELWLVLDRALALREGGYEVGVGTFCPRDLTPRNLLIRADLPQRP